MPFSNFTQRKRLSHLHAQQIAHITNAAQTVRDWKGGPERLAAAQSMIRDAMVAHTLRRLSLDERNAILSILSFARVQPSPDGDSQADVRLNEYDSALEQAIGEPPFPGKSDPAD